MTAPKTNSDLFKRAQLSIPGGVNSPVRAFKAVGGTPYFVERASGAHIWDVEGTRYLDFVQSWGASILGHAHPEVIGAIKNAASRGTSYGAPTEAEIDLAEAIAARFDGCEMVRLVSSGTEATMSAIRLARAQTGRSKIIKFDGCYHGHSDGLLAGGGSGVSTLGLPGSAGVPERAVADTQVSPYNQVPEVDETTAAVIVEPVAANMGLVPPTEGFLQGLRSACDAAGALLIFDEVITGFRVHPNGASGLYGVRPDLWCFGKVVGGGLPVGAFGASREVMSRLSPLGDVYQAGTLSGNPLATAAGLKVLELLTADVYDQLAERSTRFAEELESALGKNVSCRVQQVGPLVGLFFGDGTVTNHDEAKQSGSSGVYARFFHHMLDRKIALPPSPYEVFFPGLGHSDSDVDEALEAASQFAG